MFRGKDKDPRSPAKNEAMSVWSGFKYTVKAAFTGYPDVVEQFATMPSNSPDLKSAKVGNTIASILFLSAGLIGMQHTAPAAYHLAEARWQDDNFDLEKDAPFLVYMPLLSLEALALAHGLASGATAQAAAHRQNAQLPPTAPQ